MKCWRIEVWVLLGASIAKYTQTHTHRHTDTDADVDDSDTDADTTATLNLRYMSPVCGFPECNSKCMACSEFPLQFTSVPPTPVTMATACATWYKCTVCPSVAFQPGDVCPMTNNSSLMSQSQTFQLQRFIMCKPINR